MYELGQTAGGNTNLPRVRGRTRPLPIANIADMSSSCSLWHKLRAPFHTAPSCLSYNVRSPSGLSTSGSWRTCCRARGGNARMGSKESQPYRKSARWRSKGRSPCSDQPEMYYPRGTALGSPARASRDCLELQLHFLKFPLTKVAGNGGARTARRVCPIAQACYCSVLGLCLYDYQRQVS